MPSRQADVVENRNKHQLQYGVSELLIALTGFCLLCATLKALDIQWHADTIIILVWIGVGAIYVALRCPCILLVHCSLAGVLICGFCCLYLTGTWGIMYWMCGNHIAASVVRISALTCEIGLVLSLLTMGMWVCHCWTTGKKAD